MDRVTKFSLDYLKAIQERLHIQYNEVNEPVYSLRSVNLFSFIRLREDFLDLFRGQTLDSVIADCEAYGNDLNKIQSVGYGLVTDFQKLVKLGFLQSDRVVLWDFLGTRILAQPNDSEEMKFTVGEVACNLLLLKPLVETGAVVILPHPVIWSRETQTALSELQDSPANSSHNYGLVSALSVCDRIQVHPYSYFKSIKLSSIGSVESEFYSKENFIFHNALSELFDDERFAFLNGISTNEFYNIISRHNEAKREIRKVFKISAGLSTHQINQEIASCRNDIAAKKKQFNRELIIHGLMKAGTKISFYLTLGTCFFAAKGEPVPLVISGALTSLSPALQAIIEKHFSKPQRPIYLTAFKEMEEVYDRQQLQEYLNDL